MKNNSGAQLYQKAKTLIPGGTMLLSKRPEMHLPENWPSYYSKSVGCEVVDLDGNCYVDTYIMGIGTNTLGYGYSAVDNAVIETIKKGNMSTFCCPEEVELAEVLTELHPWADMVRFSRSGGEANAIAVRIARAASGRDKVAICGYHGWHDWYLSSNLGDSQGLDGHLLPGLEPKGVPRALKGTTLPFQYNNIEEFQNLIRENPDIGAVKMEVTRNQGPVKGYLEQIRKICNENNLVLIFDECTSGFRETFGGIHLKYGVEPDVCMLGKTLGNGYAITAVLGKKEIMESAQSTFISSTFWTERIGYAAGLKTLEIMEKEKSWIKISNLGKYVKHLWKEIANDNNLEIKLSGIDALPSFNFIYKNNLAYRTYVTQEMLKKGFLATNVIYMSTKHEKKMIDKYIQELNKIFKQIKKFEEGLSIKKYLNTDVINPSFKRLTD